MARALQLAELGRGHVSPNPMVGCVIVHQGKIIGEGYHRRYGEAHAEVNALTSVKQPDLLPESTVYVTLEPCSHHGKTPPCADLLIAKKVKRVVISTLDPFEKVNGKGAKRLDDAGIAVETGLLEREAQELNCRFFTAVKKQRPYVILKWAQTFDGFLARENYDSKWISNAYSRQLVHKWRTEEDAILVGKNTALFDNPRLTSREWAGKNPVRVLLDSNLAVKPDAPIFNADAPTIIFNRLKDEKAGHIEWIKVEENLPERLLVKLHERKIQSVIVEGGTQVFDSFMAKNCWDEARVFISNQTFGKGIPAPLLVGEVVHEEFIDHDRLIIYKNNHG